MHGGAVVARGELFGACAEGRALEAVAAGAVDDCNRVAPKSYAVEREARFNHRFYVVIVFCARNGNNIVDTARKQRAGKRDRRCVSAQIVVLVVDALHIGNIVRQGGQIVNVAARPLRVGRPRPRNNFNLALYDTPIQLGKAVGYGVEVDRVVRNAYARRVVRRINRLLLVARVRARGIYRNARGQRRKRKGVVRAVPRYARVGGNYSARRIEILPRAARRVPLCVVVRIAARVGILPLCPA